MKKLKRTNNNKKSVRNNLLFILELIEFLKNHVVLHVNFDITFFSKLVLSLQLHFRQTGGGKYIILEFQK